MVPMVAIPLSDGHLLALGELLAQEEEHDRGPARVGPTEGAELADRRARTLFERALSWPTGGLERSSRGR